MKERIIILSFLLILPLLSNADVTIYIESDTLCIGTTNDTVHLSMDNTISNVHEEIVSNQYDVLFDTSCFYVKDVKRTPRTQDQNILDFSEIEGGIRIVMGPLHNVIPAGTGPIIDIIVVVTDSCRVDSYPWILTNTILANPLGVEISHTVIDGEITISECDLYSLIISSTEFDFGDVYTGFADWDILRVSNVGCFVVNVSITSTGCATAYPSSFILEAKGSKNVEVYCTPQEEGPCNGQLVITGGGEIEIPVSCNGIIPDATKGDVNDDGSIDVRDVVMCVNEILGIFPYIDPKQDWAADCNGPLGNCDGDGLKNALDALKIVNFILGLDECSKKLVDIDGNVYRTVRIGEQVWMAENLKVTHYRNGDPIPNVIDNSTWENLRIGAYCNYNNDLINVSTFGRLYNWYAVSDSRNIAPEGWRVPNNFDWQALVVYLGGMRVAGGKMKTPGTIENGDGLWYYPNTGATNESGFTAVPSGYRIPNEDRMHHADYLFLGSYSFFWSSTEHDSISAWFRNLSFDSSYTGHWTEGKPYGFSVRCVRDN